MFLLLTILYSYPDKFCYPLTYVYRFLDHFLVLTVAKTKLSYRRKNYDFHNAASASRRAFKNGDSKYSWAFPSLIGRRGRLGFSPYPKC